MGNSVKVVKYFLFTVFMRLIARQVIKVAAKDLSINDVMGKKHDDGEKGCQKCVTTFIDDP